MSQETFHGATVLVYDQILSQIKLVDERSVLLNVGGEERERGREVDVE